MTKMLQFVKNGVFTGFLVLFLHISTPLSPVFAMEAAPQETLYGSPAVVSIVTNKGPQTFSADLAVTSEQQARGLMFVKELPKNYGMIFIYTPPRVVTMWMKNTLIPLDMLFIDAEQKIVHIHENAEPQSLEHISYPKPVWAVLEIAGGTAKSKNIKTGQRVYYSVNSTSSHDEVSAHE